MKKKKKVTALLTRDFKRKVDKAVEDSEHGSTSEFIRELLKGEVNQ